MLMCIKVWIVDYYFITLIRSHSRILAVICEWCLSLFKMEAIMNSLTPEVDKSSQNCSFFVDRFAAYGVGEEACVHY